MACRLAMDEPNLQCAPKAKDFLVPMTQLPGSSSKDAHRIHTCNIRYTLGTPYCVYVFFGYLYMPCSPH